MKQDMNIEVELPEGVTAKLTDQKSNEVELSGSKGSISRSVPRKNVKVDVSGNKISIKSKSATKREKKIVFTYRAHLKNAIKGVSAGFEYKLKICSGHFPMSVGVKGNTLEIKNFIGEKVPRVLKLKQGADVKIDGEIITVTGTDKEIVSTVASDIELLTRRPGFDHRIFQDGIYIIEKDCKQI